MAEELAKNEDNIKIYETETETEEDDDQEEDELEVWEDWTANDDEDGGSDSELLCLFCDIKFSSCNDLFEHCSKCHNFDFYAIKEVLKLDFYGCFKLINFVRSKVADNSCWNCNFTCQSIQELQKHLHDSPTLNDIKILLDNDDYLKPFMLEDALLFNFGEDEEGEEDYGTSTNKEDQINMIENFDAICIDKENDGEAFSSSDSITCATNGVEVASPFNGSVNLENSLDKMTVNGNDAKESNGSSNKRLTNRQFQVNVAAKEIKHVNENYFGAYSSFGIHREMISDKVRMDAYRHAILNNPSLFSGAVVMDVGCGTGVLSLFAAQAGASQVIAIEASEKMAAVAAKIAKDNGHLHDESPRDGTNQCTGVIKVVKGMVEELDKSVEIQPRSVDVLLSEWMGYCLLYETMLSSVLLARDKWLKPGGAILPDTTTIFAAGFGKGGTSLPFWEDVYGFNMSSIGKELVEDAAQNPIVDVMDGRDIVTDSVVLKAFDLVTMTADEMDFTATIELCPKSNTHNTTWCYGLVLWFETGFTSRFCKEMATVLSTSPYTPKTHWAQTIFTFNEPIAISSAQLINKSALVGSEACPARSIQSRVSIVRAVPHRSIDVSLEITGVGLDSRKRSWPSEIIFVCRPVLSRLT